MRKTKIVCTLGPSTDREGVLREMIQAGMNVARFNFSHGTHAEHKARLDALKALREELDAPVAAMLDTKGPEVRLKDFAGGRVHLTAGQEFTLTTVQVEGDAHRCSITYGELPGDVKAGDTILLDDGLVRLTVLETSETEIRCRVENDGDMKNHKGVNVPGVRLNMPYMSQQDRDDLLFGAEQGFDYVAASFVRSAADVRELRHVLDKAGSRMRIIAKIENQEGVSNLPEILALILHKNPHARIVATAVTLESAAALTGCMKNFKSADCISMQVSKASAAGSYHLMKAQNPVWIFTLQNGGACS